VIKINNTNISYKYYIYKTKKVMVMNKLIWLGWEFMVFITLNHWFISLLLLSLIFFKLIKQKITTCLLLQVCIGRWMYGSIL